jgi:hypothetical protein
MSDEKKPRRFVTPARLYREVNRVIEAHGLQPLDTIGLLLDALVGDVLAEAIGNDTDD